MSKQSIYIGTGGYSDTDLIGTLYPQGTSSSQFLNIYQQYYDTVEINSTFHAPIAEKAIQGMLEKSQGNLLFSVKLHQDFSHQRTATYQNAEAFMNHLTPLIDATCLAHLFLQFPQSFVRNKHNRLYLAKMLNWFQGLSIAIEFRHPSWHIPPVFEYFKQQSNLIWCNVDYPPLADLPTFNLQFNQEIGYLRLHGHNLKWHDAQSAKERHDYRYTDDELQKLAHLIHQQRHHFKQLFIYFQNTTHSHSVYNIDSLKSYLLEYGFNIKNNPVNIQKNGLSQGDLF
ncbi:DUF72 domain-containing protein [Moraxella sp. ZY210820]|uniref:DUF72 domain-containing protein n=1 Tax=unclassified Moraxella TaxID=2685852 RepID=UPI00272F6DFF|nr:DUF72 domain-containing protein [Moraxella sp. ZY210820]WLF85014.1 DUF72 domain-containing protein [Moraxella sp. ZY210820]